MEKSRRRLNKAQRIESRLLDLKTIFPYQRGVCSIFEDVTEEGREENKKYLNEQHEYTSLLEALRNTYKTFIQTQEGEISYGDSISSERVKNINVNLGLIDIREGAMERPIISSVQINSTSHSAFIGYNYGFEPLFQNLSWTKQNENVKTATLFAPRNYHLEMLIENEFFNYIKKDLDSEDIIKNERIVNNGLDFVGSLLGLLPVLYER